MESNVEHSDTQRPCTTCAKSHAHSRKINPLVTPEQPDCTYDKEGELPESIQAKINRLEARIGKSRDTFLYDIENIDQECPFSGARIDYRNEGSSAHSLYLRKYLHLWVHGSRPRSIRFVPGHRDFPGCTRYTDPTHS